MLIGLAGAAGSGKDTVGTILKHNHDFKLLALAYPIKEMICGLLRVDMDSWDDREWRETVIPLYKQSPRQLAQTIGTEWGRVCVHEDMWMDRLFEEVQTYTREIYSLLKVVDAPKIAITDVRFDNEAVRIQSYGGHVIKVVRPVTTLVGSAAHPSEEGISDHLIGVWTIYNRGSIDDLTVSVQRILNLMRGITP